MDTQASTVEIEEMLGPDRVDAMIAVADPSSPVDRARALKAVASAIEQHIAPAADLLVDMGCGVLGFDMDAAAGAEVLGLLLGLLARQTPTLAVPADDQAIAAALRSVDIELETAERGRALYRAWQARRASTIAKAWIGFLGAGAADETSSAHEAEALWALSSTRPALPDDLIGAMADFIARRAPDVRASLLRECRDERLRRILAG